MYSSVGVLAWRSLRQDSRILAQHLMRGACGIGAYFILSWSSAYSVRNDVGLLLLQTQLFVNALMLSAAAVFQFSQVIVEEKEERTLGLLRLAGISGLSLILGKCCSPLAAALFLLLLQWPFTVLCITLGGVTWNQVAAAYVSLGAYLVFLIGVAAAASVVAKTATRAVVMTAIVIGGYLWLPSVLFPFGWNAGVRTTRVNIVSRLEYVTQTTFTDPPGCPGDALHIALGLMGLAAAWWSLDRFTADEPTSLLPMKLQHIPLMNVPKQLAATAENQQLPHELEPPATSIAARPIDSPFRRDRPWTDHPLQWKDFWLKGGGWVWVVLRLVAVALLMLYLTAQSHTDRWEFVAGAAVFTFWAWFWLFWESTFLAVRLVHDEIKQKTWSDLAMLPQSLEKTTIDLLLGCCRAHLPTLLSAFGGLFALWVFSVSAMSEVASNNYQLYVPVVTALSMAAFVMLWVCYLLAITAMAFRSHWLAVVFAWGSLWLTMFGYGLLTVAMGTIDALDHPFGWTIYLGVTIGAELWISYALLKFIQSDLHRFAEQ